ncbi:MAG: serine hydrolase [Aureispira sp.]|nr:serine hydrolase [Aureispira sp.]
MKRQLYSINKYSIGIILVLMITGCHAGRFIIWNFADIRDHKKFAKIDLEIDESKTFKFQETDGNVFVKPTFTSKKDSTSHPSLEQFLKNTKTVAFLVIRNDSILYEKYLYGRDTAALVPSFSAAKSVVSALVGIAIAEGHIDSIQDFITKYIPELPSDPFGKITIEHLLNMRSGLDFKEEYFNPFGHVAKFYYGTNLRKFTKQLKAKEAPGKTFEYISVNTQLLGWAVEEATGQNLVDYLEEKIWKPLGMETPASWSIDSRKQKLAKAFCCLNATARDFAKFGRLYLNRGDWNGKQIIPERWVVESSKFNGGGYKYQWWKVDKESYAAIGFLGQYIYINPNQNLIMIRLGKQQKTNWERVFRTIAKLN